eukprot:jgi/Psemu1/262456/estExt_Genewise1Plus.C_7730007
MAGCVVLLILGTVDARSGLPSSHINPGKASVLVVGSANADTFLPVARLPTEGENLTLLPGRVPIVDVPGGKGCTQAVAVAKLLRETPNSKCLFLGQLGSDPAGEMLRSALEEHGVDCSHCGVHSDLPSGRGYVFWQTSTGSVSAIVSGGSNSMGWAEWECAWKERGNSIPTKTDLEERLETLLEEEGVRCVLLQREVPECVNLLIASCNDAPSWTPIVVYQDAGGEDRPISEEMLSLCDFLVPNESEARRLVASSSSSTGETTLDAMHCATALQDQGAGTVLVTLGVAGSLLVDASGDAIRAPAIACSESVEDETGAGDCFRAAFAVAHTMEGRDTAEAMRLANAAGSCSVRVQGAVPSTPDRKTIEEQLDSPDEDNSLSSPLSSSSDVPRGGGGGLLVRGGSDESDSGHSFPFLIGSRLNSMKDRPELWEGKPLDTPRDFVKRQGKIRGLTCVDFNYPQHFGSSVWGSYQEAKEALEEEGLVAGAVCLRYPSKFARGAMNHPDPALRAEALTLTKEAAEVAQQLGCDEVVIWSAFDGYDYPFQVEYDEQWDQLVSAFRELCDAFPGIQFSLEYKPTDENTRFFTVPTTGAALLLVDDIDRENMGLTLDVGHMLMAGENPGQSIAMVGRRGKLFGVQLNDGFTRLAAEDGLMFGSVHPSMALEIMYQLYRTKFAGHFYFDTFPQRTDPILEAECNIRRVKRFWKAASEGIDEEALRKINDEHDAVGALELVDAALWKTHPPSDP